MKIAAVIPTLGERLELTPLVKQLTAEQVDCIVLASQGENLHRLWNQGAHIAKDLRGADFIAILNDDITLPDNTLKTIAQAMETNNFDCMGVDPKAEFGIDGNLESIEITGNVGVLMTEVTTWCFVVRASAWQEIDEQYEWWYGVGDLFTKIVEAGGRLGQLRGLGIKHVGSGTARFHGWTEEAKARDAKRWRAAH